MALAVFHPIAMSDCWAAFVGDCGEVVGVEGFGASAPANVLFEHYGLTVENVSRAVRDSLAAANASEM